MATTYYVRKTGSDNFPTEDGSTTNPWLTIQYAFSNSVAGDTIIVDDATPQTYDEAIAFTDYRILTAGAGCYCDGTKGSGAKLTRTSSGNVLHFTGASASAHQVHGFEIVLDNTGVSAEAIHSESNTLVNDCIVYATAFTSQQDGLYFQGTKTNHVINTQVFHFGRHCYQPASVGTTTYFQHCTLYNPSAGGETIRDYTAGATIRIDNSIVAHDTAANTIVGSTSYVSVNNDNAHTEPSATWGTEATNGVVAGTQGSGSYICFTNITAGSEDLTLVSGAGNVAVGLAETDHTANATYDPNGDTAESVNGETRDYVSAHDAGAWEIVAASGTTIPLVSRHLQNMMSN